MEVVAAPCVARLIGPIGMTTIGRPWARAPITLPDLAMGHDQAAMRQEPRLGDVTLDVDVGRLEAEHLGSSAWPTVATTLTAAHAHALDNALEEIARLLVEDRPQRHIHQVAVGARGEPRGALSPAVDRARRGAARGRWERRPRVAKPGGKGTRTRYWRSISSQGLAANLCLGAQLVRLLRDHARGQDRTTCGDTVA